MGNAMWIQFRKTILSTVRLVPAFALLAVGGALMAHFFFHVLDAQLGVVVSIWMTCAFVLWNLAVVVIPAPAQTYVRPPAALMLLTLPIFLGMIFGPIFLLASGAYRLVGLPSVATGSLHVAGGCLSVVLCGFGLTVALAVAAATSLHSLCIIVVLKTVQALSEFVRTPTQLLDQLTPPVSHIR